MSQTIRIAPLSRIEGHAGFDILLDDAGNVADARMQVYSLRGFEQFVVGRPAEELPRIVTRICGICPWQHHLASMQAVEKCLGVTPTPTGLLLRELCQMLASIPDKILHFYFLASPDFVVGPGADYSVRNITGVIAAAPDLAKEVVHQRYVTQMALEKFAGKVIHPIAAVAGGFSKPLLESERQELLAVVQSAKDFSLRTMAFARSEVFPRYIDAVKTLGVFSSGYLGTVRPADGALELFEGRLRLMDAQGDFTDFAYEDFGDHVAEHVESWSYLKFPYMKKAGRLVLDETTPVGVYRSNALARVNVCDRMATPLAQQELEIFRKEFGRPAHLTLLYHWARLMELVYCCERAEELLHHPDITGREHRITTRLEPVAGTGVGCVEAPRGSLIYQLATDDNGMISSANMIMGTTHNNAGMNLSVRQAAKTQIKDGIYDETILNSIEMAVRAYDP